MQLATANNGDETVKKKIFIGDSWGAGRNSSNGIDDGWKSIVNEEDHILGVYGSTASQWASDYNGWLTKAKEKSKNADIVIVSLMGNDAFNLFYSRKYISDDIHKICNDFRFVIENFKEKRIIVLLYEIPKSINWRLSLVCMLLNSFIKTSLFGLNVEYADMSKWLQPEHLGGEMPLHPFESGWEIACQKMSELIEGK